MQVFKGCGSQHVLDVCARNHYTEVNTGVESKGDIIFEFYPCNDCGEHACDLLKEKGDYNYE
jgi:hypothetical protein